jgi:hypothetical protein
MNETTTTLSQPIIRTRQLTLEELKTIPVPMTIQDDVITITHSLRNWPLQQPVILSLSKVLAAKEKGLINYILSAFLSERPALLPFVFDNQSLLKMARHFLRHCSASLSSCFVYTATIQNYSTWLGYSPDLIIQDIKPVGNIPAPQRVQNHQGYLAEYIAQLQTTFYLQAESTTAQNTFEPSTEQTHQNRTLRTSQPQSHLQGQSTKARRTRKLLEIADLREKTIYPC